MDILPQGYCAPHTAPMSASIQKTRFTAIGIHKAPANLPKKDFDAKMDALVNSLVALPVAQQTFLSFDLVRVVGTETLILMSNEFRCSRTSSWTLP
jgi:hypothetical protein